jgi:hypothetical protein
MPKSNNYEIVASFVSAVIAGMSGVLYYETTAKAQWYRRASGIGANVIENYFFTKLTIDYLADLIEKKKYVQATAAVLVALAAYAPQVFISWVEAPKEFDLGMKIFATSATALAGAVLYAYAVANLVPFAVDSVRTVKQEGSYAARSICGSVSTDEVDARKTKETVLRNLRLLREKIAVSNYADFVFTLDHENMLDKCERLAKYFAPMAKLPDCGPALSRIAGSIKLMLQLTTASLMVYGSLGYTCDTERSLKEDFHASVLLATIAANVLMFFQNVLGVKGGFGLISGIADSLTPLKYGRLLSNDHRVGGVAGTVTTLASPLLAGVIASYSGFTGEELYNSSCPGTPMGSLMMPHGASIVNYSSVGFNGIYNVMTFLWMVKYLTQTLGDPKSQDNQYLKLASELDELIGCVEKANPSNVRVVLVEHDSQLSSKQITALTTQSDDAAPEAVFTRGPAGSDVSANELGTEEGSVHGLDQPLLHEEEQAAAPGVQPA